MFLFPTTAMAQTFYHDSGVFNQFLLTGADPASGYVATTNPFYTTYMQTFHSGYFRTAPVMFSIINHRAMTKMNVDQEKEYADSISKDLLRRAEKEGLTVLDRSKVGGAISSYVEEPHIQDALAELREKVTNLSFTAGAGHHDLVYNWKGICSELEMSFKVVNEASFLPSAERKKEYLNILNDIKNRTKQLDGIALQLEVEKEIKKEQQAEAFTPHRFSEVATLCMIRWRDSARSKMVNNSHSGGGTPVIPTLLNR